MIDVPRKSTEVLEVESAENEPDKLNGIFKKMLDLGSDIAIQEFSTQVRGTNLLTGEEGEETTEDFVMLMVRGTKWRQELVRTAERIVGGRHKLGPARKAD